ncbi:diacylglycerol/lipid kinase family protein [Holophaga foetida]|uniref:diacylglycerol/lipid kinase family protein n=1 Tax=Holophaga foetida TaxID=35839 RepID=UPI0002472A90|nr:diacylglycerol kinase family protein [Holophaga foetida]
MSPKLPLVYNPRSGPRGKDPDALMSRLSPELRERIEPAPFGPPWDFGPLIAQAQAAGGPLLVWGGDGTLHHAGRALVAAGCPVPLAAIPGGSGNGLVRGLRTPLEPAGAVMNLLQGRELVMDLPRLDGVPFLNLCGTGFEAAVAHAFEAVEGRGFTNYAKLCLRLWRDYPETEFQWEASQPESQEPGRSLDRLRAAWRGAEPSLPDRAWSLCFANLPQFGSGFWIAPGADPTDGILQWARLKRPSVFDLLSEVPQFFREGGRTSLRQEGRLLRATLRLERSTFWHLDGEAAPARDRAELTLERRAFRMQVTSSCPW